MYSTSELPFGTEKVARRYVELFLANGHDVLFVYRHPYDIEGLDNHCSALQQHCLQQRGWFDLLRARRRISAFRPDIIFIHNHFSRFLVLGKYVAPLVGIAHLDKFGALKHYDGVIALTATAAQQAIAAGIRASHISVIGNTANITQTIPARQHFRSPPIIGGIGRLTVVKNFPVFIDALQILRQRGLSFRAVLAGSGEDETALRTQATAAKLDDTLTFLGFVKDTAAFFDGIDIFCAPSNVESFGLVVLEAMVANKPIIASNIPSFEMLLNDRHCGLLFDHTSPLALADALQQMIEKPQLALAMGRKANDYYQQHYSAEKIYQQLENLINRITAIKANNRLHG